MKTFLQFLKEQIETDPRRKSYRAGELRALTIPRPNETWQDFYRRKKGIRPEDPSVKPQDFSDKVRLDDEPDDQPVPELPLISVPRLGQADKTAIGIRR